MRRILIFIAIALFAAVASGEEKVASIPIDDSPSLGPVNAPVTIIEFIDFQ